MGGLIGVADRPASAYADMREPPAPTNPRPLADILRGEGVAEASAGFTE